MNQKKSFKTDWKPSYLHEVQVPSGSKTYTLRKGMEATLVPPVGRKENRRYRFEYAEMLQGELMLTFYGPVRGTAQRYRNVRPAAVLAVHIKSEAR